MSTFRILVVDDSPAVCRFVELAVGSDAVHVVGAADVQGALAIVNGNELDLALVATAFAGLAGRDIVATLASRNVPVALVTGNLDQTGVDTGAATGGVLVKPLDVEVLRQLVARVRSHSLVGGSVAVDDPIESWLSEADARLGFIRKSRRGQAADADAIDRFERDVSSLRRQPARTRLEMKPSQRISR